MKKIFMAAILLGLLGMILVFHWNAAEVEANAVSYTHLTLPTNREV